jgi:hypothetical protein
MAEFIGMTNDRMKQLEENPELRQEAHEEIWAEMLRARQRLDEIRVAHYLIYYPQQHESSPELTDEQNEIRLQGLIEAGWGVKK